MSEESRIHKLLGSTSAYFQRHSVLYYVLGTSILLIAGLKWAWNLRDNMDITFGDEAQYLRYGLDLFLTIKTDWGPSYNVWYKCLSFFRSSTVDLFYLNQQVTAIALGVTLFVFLMRYKISFVISLWISFCFLFSTTVIDTWPRVSHFAIIVLLITLTLIKNIASKPKYMLWTTLAFYIAAYARPELFIAFLLISIITAHALFIERKNIKDWLPTFLFIAVILIINFIIYQLPANSYKGINRTYIAFSQHYAINYVIENKASFNPISEWIAFAHQTFGDCTNFFCILKTHPSLVIHNTILNIQRYVLTLFQFSIDILIPVKIIGSKKLQLLVIIGLPGCLIYILNNKTARAKLFQQLRDHQLLLFILLLFGLPSIGASIVIFPRQHYLLMHSILIILCIAILFNSIAVISKINPLIVGLLFIPILIKAPTANKYLYNQLESDNKNHCNKRLTEYLSSTKDKDRHVIFSNHLSLSMMLPSNFSDFNTEYEYQPGMKFSNVLKEKKIDYVVVRDILIKEKLLNSDTSWINFIKSPQAYNFKKKIYCDSCSSYLLVKAN